ncbi:transporter substrate-binding domain-containing protein [Rhizobium oryzicola]|uniref:Transporter substrate-binding domain-containing protein n=1 Tax=Rhizobium oryzicola TaxID=1232668 RepID=A0ABT8SRM4_9HYPH|nr:transporter substrate-binding domain-containing protein [Rhizobium oryzicola]MDO1580880.1 transporter substrate-binding domain-containing protein [Rhizobium oryzicola]
MSFLLSHVAQVAAADGQSLQMPVLFDAAERLPKPDLATLPRLRFLATVDFPPFSFVDQAGKLTGFHVDLVREICAVLAVEPKCQIQSMPFNDIANALESGGGEAAIAGNAVTAELRQRFAFSRPYTLIPARFVQNLKVHLQGNAAEALKGRTVGVVQGTSHERMLTAFFASVKPARFASQEEMLEAVKAGTVDAAFSDGLRLPFWVASGASNGCCALFDGPYLSQQFLGEGLSMMVRKDAPVVAPALNYALAELSRNGRLQEIYLRYFPNGLF